jgi:hypothetical protein
MAELAREDAPAAVEPSTRIVRGTGAASAPLELASSDDEAPRETKKAPTQRFFWNLNVTRSPRWLLHETTSRRRRRRHDPTRIDARRRRPAQETKKKTAAPATATPAIEPLVADASAPGKRHIDLTASSQAEPPKRARRSESANKAAPAPEEDERPTEAEPQDDEAAPQREEEDATPFSRGVAVAEIDIMRYVESFRASGNSQLADAIEATIVTTAAQRQAALVPRPPPENELSGARAWRKISEIRAKKARDLGDEFGIAMYQLRREELDQCNERMSQHNQWLADHPFSLLEQLKTLQRT